MILHYVTIWLSYLFAHIDVGIFAVSYGQIKIDLGIDDSDLGLIESALYIGIVIGSPLVPIIYKLLPPKVVIIGAIVGQALGISVIVFVSQFWVIFASRIFVGFFQVNR